MTMPRQQRPILGQQAFLPGMSAQGRTTDPFIAGDPRLARQMAFADALAARGADTSPVGHPLEAGIRLATAGLAGYQGRQAEEGALKSRETYKKALVEALAGMRNATGPDGAPLNQADRIRSAYETMAAATAGNPHLPNPFEQSYMSALTKDGEDIKLDKGQTLFRRDAQGNLKEVARGAGDQAKLGDIRKLDKGTSQISQEWDGTAWKDLAEAPRWQEETWTPETRNGVSGQVNSRTKEWKPADMRPSTNVSTSTHLPPQQNATEKWYGDQFASFQEGGLQADRMNTRLDRMGNLLDQVNTGKFAGNILELKKAAKQAGVDLASFNIKDDTPYAEAAAQLSNEIALQLRSPAGGAGMPGAMSDKDREFLQSMVPGLETTAEGRKLMLETSRKLNRRTIDVARRARDYAGREGGNGGLDAKFFTELQAWSDTNSLFPQAGGDEAARPAAPPKPAASASPLPPPKPGDVVDGHRFKGGSPSDPNAWEAVP